jgi:uncharacterized protein GlcG (DUF336 family)
MSIKKRTIDARTMWRIIEACVERAEELDKKVSIAITDEAGHLRAFHAMDGAAHLTIEIAQNKAYTASAFGMPTHVWWDFIKNDPPLLHGITHTPRLVVFGGGYPIMEKDQMIGAIGISGGHYSDDMEVARAGLAWHDRSLEA